MAAGVPSLALKADAPSGGHARAAIRQEMPAGCEIGDHWRKGKPASTPEKWVSSHCGNVQPVRALSRRSSIGRTGEKGDGMFKLIISKSLLIGTGAAFMAGAMTFAISAATA